MKTFPSILAMIGSILIMAFISDIFPGISNRTVAFVASILIVISFFIGILK